MPSTDDGVVSCIRKRAGVGVGILRETNDVFDVCGFCWYIWTICLSKEYGHGCRIKHAEAVLKSIDWIGLFFFFL
jgi:hypothetical protein